MPLSTHIRTWNDGADCVLDKADDQDTYVCRFDRLVKDPENESKRILSFLGLPDGETFVPTVTKAVDFSDEELTLIQTQTNERWQRIRELPIHP